MERRIIVNNTNKNKSRNYKRKKLNNYQVVEVQEEESDEESEGSEFEDVKESRYDEVVSISSEGENEEEEIDSHDEDGDDVEDDDDDDEEEEEEENDEEQEDEGYDDNQAEGSKEAPSSDEEDRTESIDHNKKLSQNLNITESPKPEYQLTTKLVHNVILTDLTKKQWKIGKPIGKGSFGEIFLASDNINVPVTNDNAKFVVKFEPHSNGPLFVEIHCLINTSKLTDENTEAIPGIPRYIASGSHYFHNNRYRFLILPRFGRDLHSLIKNCRVDPKSILVLAVQILDILKHLHDKGYCHSDIKAENLMIGKEEKKILIKKENKTHLEKNCKSKRSLKNTNRKKSCSNFSIKEENLEDFIDDTDWNDDNSYQDDEEICCNNRSTRKRNSKIEFGGPNPIRSCRTTSQYIKDSRNHSKKNSINEAGNHSACKDTNKSHYLRPAKKINYSEFSNDENSKSSYNDDDYDSRTIDEFIIKHRNLRNCSNSSSNKMKMKNVQIEETVTEDRIFLIDYGLALKLIDASGVHRPFCMDQRRAHDGTLEFTSRDAHMGAHSRRSDLECLGYNLIYWSQGYLPWKEKAAAQQHEKVHWMKEYLMTDVREMLKHVYGKQVPKYLGDYMHLVNQLSYDETPQYDKLKQIFQQEFESLGGSLNDMHLNVDQLIRHSIKIKNSDIENNNNKMKNGNKIMKNLGILTPSFQIINASTNSNSRVSPKNLRSKRNSATGGKSEKKKKFSWAEVLSQDPDQIARKRAEKEFEREQNIETPVNKYIGKPTYAILEIQNKIKFKDRLESLESDETDRHEFQLQGYTKPMMDILKKKHISLFTDWSKTSVVTPIHSPRQHSQTQTSIREIHPACRKSSKKLAHPISPLKRTKQHRCKNNITSNITQILECESNDRRSRNRIDAAKKLTKSVQQNSGGEFNSTDESSIDSVGSSNVTAKNSISSKSNSLSSSSMPKRLRKQNRRYLDGFVTINQQQGNVSENSNCSNTSQTSVATTSAIAQSYPGSLSDEDTRDMFDSNTIKKRGRGRRPLNKLKIKINGTATIVKEVSPVQNITVNRRKGIPRKRNSKGEFRCI